MNTFQRIPPFPRSGERQRAEAGSAPCRRATRPSGVRRILAVAVILAGFETAALHAADADPQRTRELVAVLQSNAALHERARACQQLAILGTSDAIPALSALLADDRLGHYARDALQLMPDPAAGAALRDALGRLEGNSLIGVVNSIGQRRDAAAVPALTAIASDRGSPAAAVALLALGRIATPEAVRATRNSLTSGSPELRAAAAEACLLAADQNLDQGRRDVAIMLYDAVRKATPPGQLRATATHGAILAHGSGGLPLLIEHLHSSDVALRDVALRAARELPDDQVGAALVDQLERAKPPLRALLLLALADRGDRSAVPAVESHAGSSEPEVRLAALSALGRIGAASSVPTLLNAITANRSPAEVEAAAASLFRIAVPDTDAMVLRALPLAGTPARIRLIGVLGERRSEAALPELLKLAGGADAALARASFEALMVAARPSELPALIQSSLAAGDDATRTLADRTVVMTSMKVLEPENRADAVLAAFRQAAAPETKAALLRPLGAVVRSMPATFAPFAVVRAALADPSPLLRDAAIRCLAAWPDATPSTALLDVVSRERDPARRELAFTAAVRMAANVAAGRERSPLNVVAFLTDANALVRTREEKLAMVSALGSLRHVAAFNLLRPYLDDADVRNEAALAMVQVAPALLKGRQGADVKAVLAKIAADVPDDDTRKKATRAMKGLPTGSAGKQKAGGGQAVAAGNRAPPAVPAGALFNGTDFSGWEGDPGVWRIRDGAIVGGSLEGNPRNEFLATTKPFRNFVLRLEYKLTGTEGFVNGGVQFRSVRVKQPPNEMSGYQADIGAGHSGKLYDESRRKKFLAEPAADRVARVEKPGDWNRYEIRCEGPTIELTLNGEKTITYVEPDASIPPTGLIALQIHGKCKAEIAFRNIAIEELK